MEMPKGVQLMELSPDKVKTLWEKLHVIDGLFDDYSRGNFQFFVSRLQQPDSVWLERTDGNGILYLTQVRPGLSAFGHIVYWDKRLRGREDFTLSSLLWLMDMLSLSKVNVWIPDYSKAAIAFLKRLGFKHEGTLRDWSYSNGKLFNMEAFGIRQEEVLNERVYDTGNGHVPRTENGSSAELLSESSESSSADGPEQPSELQPSAGDSGSDADSGHTVQSASTSEVSE